MSEVLEVGDLETTEIWVLYFAILNIDRLHIIYKIRVVKASERAVLVI